VMSTTTGPETSLVGVPADAVDMRLTPQIVFKIGGFRPTRIYVHP
jgi:hypothetical protein